jgi:hypothetical protein
VSPRPIPLPPDPELQDRETVVEGEEMTVFRIVKTADRNSSAFVACFRSRKEQGRPPQRGTPQETHPAIYVGITCWDTAERAIATELQLRKADRGVGDFVAAVRLDQVAGATYYFWGPPGHLTVWADAIKLAEATVDILPIRQESAVHAVPHPRQTR